MTINQRHLHAADLLNRQPSMIETQLRGLLVEAHNDRSALLMLLHRFVDHCEYKTPAGATNCRHCDNNMDHEGTYKNMHAEDCIIRTAQGVLT